MVFAAQLPQEILFHIFQNLKSEELVKAERVCKAWYQNSRRHKILWRDASLYNEEKANFCPIKYYNRFKCLAERNGNNFTKLFLNICLMSLPDDDIRKLIMVLPLVKVEELWIVIGFKRHCPPNHPHCYLPYHTTMQKRSSEAIKIIVTAVLQAIIRLTTLTKLRISSGVDVGEIDLSSCGDPAEWPINRCKLEELHLIRLRYDILFPEEANHQNCLMLTRSL